MIASHSIMIQKLVHALVFLLLVGISINAQQGMNYSIQQRAQSLEPYFVDSARRYGIDPRILRVLCYLESRFRLDAISPKGARGPMQFMPETAARYGLMNPHDPKRAIDAAARYFRDLLHRFDGRIDLAFAAYNAGEGTVEAFRNGRVLRLSNGKVINAGRSVTGGIPPYHETQNYVRLAIDLLRRRGRVIAMPSGGSKTDEGLTTTRDFTIDVTLTEVHPGSLVRERSKWFFIEVQ
jgi:soluble lytic murein transglycosylase-like protein